MSEYIASSSDIIFPIFHNNLSSTMLPSNIILLQCDGNYFHLGLSSIHIKLTFSRPIFTYYFSVLYMYCVLFSGGYLRSL